jgi:hypothetical protein
MVSRPALVNPSADAAGAVIGEYWEAQPTALAKTAWRLYHQILTVDMIVDQYPTR